MSADQDLRWLQELLDAASVGASDPEETCTREPDCPGYLAVGVQQRAVRHLRDLGCDEAGGRDSPLARCALALGKCLTPNDNYEHQAYGDDDDCAEGCAGCLIAEMDEIARQALDALQAAAEAQGKV